MVSASPAVPSRFETGAAVESFAGLVAASSTPASAQPDVASNPARQRLPKRIAGKDGKRGEKDRAFLQFKVVLQRTDSTIDAGILSRMVGHPAIGGSARSVDAMQAG